MVLAEADTSSHLTRAGGPFALMEWLNLHTSTLDSPEVIGAEPVDRATWLFLLRYCVAQENAGRIANCAEWGDRKWQQLVRVTLSEVQKPSELWRFEGTDLVVNFYPLQKQREVEAKRTAGKATVAKRWANKIEPATPAANSSAYSSAISSAHTEGKGREGELEEEGKGSVAPPVAPALALSGEPAEKINRKAPAPLSDADWLASLSADPAFAGIDVPREHAKAARWCLENRKQLSRRRFVNWLNRAERPLAGAKTTVKAYL